MKFISLCILILCSLPGRSQTLVSQNFDSGTFPPFGWTFINNNGAGSGWVSNTDTSLVFDPYSTFSGNGSLVYEFDPVFPADAWAISPGISLTAGVNYAVTFYYRVEDGFYPEKLKVTFGLGNTVALQSDVIWNNNGNAALTNTLFQKGVAFFTPSVTGTYFVGFNCYSDPDKFALTLDDINIEVLPTAVPGCTNHIAPASNASGLALNNILLQWNSQAAANNYALYFSTTNPPDSFGATQDTSFAISGLSYSTTYYWSVVPANLLGPAVGCVVDSFSTQDAPPPPPNDSCGGAVSLVDGVQVNGTTIGATESLPAASCNGFTGDANDDVWYSVTTTQAGDVTCTVVPDSTLDAVMVLYAGNCSSPVQVGCADNGFEGDAETFTLSGLGANQTYFFRVYGYYGYGNEGNFKVLVTGGAILPVNMTRLSGRSDGQNNVLQWATITENNNRGFEIQRSSDGSNFSVIGFVASKAWNGNSSQKISYSFTDTKTFAGNNYYRLRQIDKDGKHQYSNTLSLNSGTSAGLVVYQAYPNPANDQVYVPVFSSTREVASYSITDIAGKSHITGQLALQSGHQVIQVPVGSLAKGNYILQIFSPEGRPIITRLVKQ